MLLESYSSIFFETWFLSTKRSAFESVLGIRQTELTVQSEIGIIEITNRRSVFAEGQELMSGCGMVFWRNVQSYE